MSSDPRTNVILVVITNKVNKTLTHDKYYKVFSPFGLIQRMLIFERQLTWKAFVEFDNPDSAIKARQALNEKHFGDDQTLLMNVYASKLEYITFQENNTGGVDYTILRKQSVTQKQTPTLQLNAQYSQTALQYQTQIQAHVSKLNTLMESLKNVCADGFKQPQYQNQDLNSQIESQMKILKEIGEQQQLIESLSNSYTTFLQNISQVSDENIPSPVPKQELRNKKKLTIPTNVYNDEEQKPQFVQLYNPQVENNFQDRVLDNDLPPVPITHQFDSDDDINQGEEQDDQNQEEIQQIESVEKLLIESDKSDKIPQLAEQIIDTTQFQPLKNEELLEDGFFNDFEDNEETRAKLKNLQGNKLTQREKQIIQESSPNMLFNRQNPKFVSQSEQLPSTNPRPKPQPNVSRSTILGPGQKIEDFTNPDFIKNQNKSRVLYARWFDKKVVSFSMIYNIFSIYGNIDKMIYLKDKSNALIQFYEQDHADIAKEALNEITFYGQQLKVMTKINKIFYSNHGEINLKPPPTKVGVPYSDAKMDEEYFQGCEETNRIKPENSYTLASPCDTIQVNNLSKNLCNNTQIHQYFSAYGQIKQLKFSFSGNKNQCIIKYSSLETALTVLANMNGLELDGRYAYYNILGAYRSTFRNKNYDI